MVQIIPANPRKSKGQMWGEALGNALNVGLQAYGQHQKQKQFQQALQNIEGAYSNPELNEQQRLIQAYQQLSGAGHPELAQQLGGQLSRLGGQQESFRNKIMGQQQEQNRLAQSFQNIQNLYSDPNLSEEQKVFGVYQELSQNPTLAHNLLGSLQKPAKVESENLAADAYSRGYESLTEGDEEGFREIIRSPDTPLSVRNKLIDLQNKFNVRKDVRNREIRARQNMVQKSYKQAIDSEKEKLKDIYTPREERPKINKRIKKLEALQKADMKRLTKDPNVYTNLHLWNFVDPEFLPEDEEEMEGLDLLANDGMKEEESQESPEIQQRVEFLNSKFPPQQFKGKKKQDKSGRIYESDGRIWRLVQK